MNNKDNEEYSIYSALLVVRQFIEEKGYKAYLEVYNKVMKDINFNRLEK